FLASLEATTRLRFWDLTSFELALTVSLNDALDNGFYLPPILAVVERRALLASGIWDIGPALDWLARARPGQPACPVAPPRQLPPAPELVPLPGLRRVLVLTRHAYRRDECGLWDLAGKCVRRLTFDVSFHHPPTVSPDGRVAAVQYYHDLQL